MKNVLIGMMTGAMVVAQTFLGGSASAAKVTLACGAVGQEFDLCQSNAQEWAKQTGNEVEMYQSPNLTNDRLGLFQQIFAAKSDQIDVVQIDVIWPGLLGKHFVDLYDYIPKSHAEMHFDAIVANNTDPDGRLVAMPFFTDAGVLYYRKDLLEKHGHKAPTTWEEMTSIAKDILSKESEANPKLVGYVFQGKPYEGLTCNVMEWLDSYNAGEIIDSETGEITVNNPKAVAALEMASSWIGTISPEGVLNYAEEDARGVFQSGNAIFMRNWPYAWALANNPDSPVAGKVGVVALPKGGKDGSHTGTLGGWNLAVSQYSKNKKEAADLVRFMTTKEIQIERAIKGGYNPTIAEAYQNEELLEANPFFGELYSTFTSAVARPSKLTGRKYNKVSNKVWNAFHGSLSGSQKPAESLKDLESDLDRIKGSRGW